MAIVEGLIVSLEVRAPEDEEWFTVGLVQGYDFLLSPPAVERRLIEEAIDYMLEANN